MTKSKRWFLSKELVIFLVLFAFALLVRIPDLYESPGFFEANELKVTLDLIHGLHFPLYNQNPHIGAFANYLIAAIFTLFGLHWWIPRTAALILGSLTVPLTYFIGRRLTNDRTAFLAAFLLLFSMYHVLMLSHVPWSNNMSPFFAALCTLCLLRATKDFSPLWLGLTGFLFGIALQTHPSMITYLLPIILIYLFAGEIPLRSRLWGFAPIITFATFIVGYANMIYFNIANRMESVSFAMTYPTYAVEMNPETGTYLKNLINEIFLLLKLLSGAAETKHILPLNWLSFILILAGILLLTGLVECLRKKEWQLPALLILPVLALPIFNKAYEFCQFGRYLGFLLVPGYLIMAAPLVNGFDRIRQKNLYASFPVLLIPIVFVITHLDQLQKFSNELELRHSSMVVSREAAATLNQVPKNTPVLVDRTALRASSLLQFLQSDGWEVRELDNAHWKTNNVSLWEPERKMVHRQIARAEKKTGMVVVISSPDFLKVLFEEEPVVNCVGCLSVKAQDVKNESPAVPIYFFTTLSNDPTRVVKNSLMMEVKNIKAGNEISKTEPAWVWNKSCQQVLLEHTSVKTEICLPDHHSRKKIRSKKRRSHLKHRNANR